jgi:alkaline phosphatase D
MALAAALAPWMTPGALAQGAPPRWQVNPFSLGVASGQPQPGSVVLWTRLRIDEADAARREQAAEVVCELFADEALRQPVRQWRLSADASRGHSLHLLADGLQPGRHYWYRFASGNAVGPVGRTRTSPALNEAVRRLRLALASCQHYEQGHYAAHRHMAAQDLDCGAICGRLHLRKQQQATQNPLARERHAVFIGRVPCSPCALQEQTPTCRLAMPPIHGS